MAVLRDIKRRIRSTENTKQITRAMKMVASAKLRRAQASMLAMRPYAGRLSSLLQHIALDLIGDEHPLFRGRWVKRQLTIVIAGDRGLCGGFNSNILRFAKSHLADHPDREHVLIAIGKRAIGVLRKEPHKILKSYYEVFEDLSYTLAADICDQLVQLYQSSDESQRIDEAWVLHNEFVSTISQQPVAKKILPIDFKELAAERAAALEQSDDDTPRPIYEIEPSVESALERLISRRIATVVYQATLESYAAELAARMTAMDNATNNAEDMIERLTLEFNRARQATITSELMDIVGGANALE